MVKRNNFNRFFISSFIYFTIFSSIFSPFSVYASSPIESDQIISATKEADLITPTLTPTPSEQPEEEELAPIDLGNNKAEIDSQKDMTAVVRQSQDYTCGPASLATLLTQLGEDTTEEQVLQTISSENISPEKGVSLLTLKQSAMALEKKVLLKKWTGEEVLSYIKETGDPVLIHDIKKNVGGHFSVIRSYDADKGLVELSDTEAGNIKYLVEDFKHIFTGHVLVITPEGTDNALLNNTSTNITDEEASTVWGKYVPVYLLAERSGDKEAIQFGKEYETCINQAMNIIDKATRNYTRATCYDTLAKKLNTDLVSNQQALLALNYNVSMLNPFDTTDQQGVGTITIKTVLENIKGLQTSYISQQSILNQKLSQIGMNLTDAINLSSSISSLKSQVSQYSYEKSQLENTINLKRNTANQLNSDLSRGSFSQNGVTFSLGSIGSQFSAQSSKFSNLSQSLNSKLNSLDGQIRNKRNQLNATNSNINSSRNNTTYYQNQANYYYSQYTRSAWWDWRRGWNWSQYVYNNGQASYHRGWINWYEGQARNIQNDINNLESQKNNAKNEVNNQYAEYARLQRLYSFGQQEMNRKQGLLTQLNNEISSLQSQLNQRIIKINSLNAQLASLNTKLTTAQSIQTIQKQLDSYASGIESYKKKYGFTTINNTNTTETERLIQEELAFVRSMDILAEDKATQRDTIVDTGLEILKGGITLAEKALLKTILLSKNISDEELGRGVAVVIGTKVYLYNQLPPSVRTNIESNTGRIQLEIMTAYNQLSPDEKDNLSRVVSVGNIVITLLPYLAVTKTMTVVKEVAVVSEETKALGITAQGLGYIAKNPALIDEIFTTQMKIIAASKGAVESMSNLEKGNFGEMATDMDLTLKGYAPLHSRINNLQNGIHQGIDGVFKKGDEFFIVESKYHGTGGLNSANPATGLPAQMTDAWINSKNRLLDAVGGDRLIEKQIQNSSYKRILSEVSPDGTVVYKVLDSQAKVISIFNP